MTFDSFDAAESAHKSAVNELTCALLAVELAKSRLAAARSSVAETCREFRKATGLPELEPKDLECAS